MYALTREVSPTITECALTFHQRQPIDLDLARAQHRVYGDCLRRHGFTVLVAPPAPDLPDAVFVEDAAVVVEELAVLTAPALPARRAEVPSMAEALAPYRTLARIVGDATLEGGDVLRLGRTLFVGRTQRTNQEGIDQLATLLRPHGYAVVAVEVKGCLHLKSACSAIGPQTILANRSWFDPRPFADYQIVEIAGDEPGAANALLLGETVILPTSFPRTRALLEERGFTVESLDVSELQKAEAALTCCSVLF